MRGALPAQAAVPTLTVTADGELGLRVCGPWSYRQLAALGLSAPGARNTVTVAEGAELPVGRIEGEIRVVHAAAPALARVRARDQRTHRARTLAEALRGERAGLNVLAQPLFPYQHAGVSHLAVAARGLTLTQAAVWPEIQVILSFG